MLMKTAMAATMAVMGEPFKMPYADGKPHWKETQNTEDRLDKMAKAQAKRERKAKRRNNG